MLVGRVTQKRLVHRERRLNANSFLSQDQALLDSLQMWSGPRRSMSDLATATKGNIFKRTYVLSPALGSTYVSAADMDRSDYAGSRLISNAQCARFDELRLTQNMVVMTRSGMNLGWAMLVRRDMDGFIGSDDLIRITTHDSEERGYIAAFLASRLGWFSVRQSISGGSVKHIEPPDVDRLQVPWPLKGVRRRIGDDFVRAAELRANSTDLIREATDEVFSCVGLQDLDEGEWARRGRELGFVARVRQRTLRAWNLSKKAAGIAYGIQHAGSRPLGDFVMPGTLRKGPSFDRIPVAPGYGVHLIGQRQLLRFRPRPKHIAKRGVPASAFCAPGTTLIAARGTFGEAETYGRAQYVSELTSAWLFSNDILRIVPREPHWSGWLYAFMRSRAAFRMVRAVATGSKQQDLHPIGLAEIPVPKGTPDAMERVNELVHKAFDLRDEAYCAESSALDGVLAVVSEDS